MSKENEAEFSAGQIFCDQYMEGERQYFINNKEGATKPRLSLIGKNGDIGVQFMDKKRNGYAIKRANDGLVAIPIVKDVEQDDQAKKIATISPSGDFDVGGHKITNVADPVSNTDAVNLQTTEKAINDAIKENVRYMHVVNMRAFTSSRIDIVYNLTITIISSEAKAYTSFYDVWFYLYRRGFTSEDHRYGLFYGRQDSMTPTASRVLAQYLFLSVYANFEGNDRVFKCKYTLIQTYGEATTGYYTIPENMDTMEINDTFFKID